MRIKVSTAKLIAAIEARKEKAKEEYNGTLIRAAKEHENYRRDVLSRLAALEKAVSGSSTVRAVAKLVDRYNLKFPDAPEVPNFNEVKKFDEVLKRLRLSDEAYMTLDDKDDYFRYV